MISRLIEYCTKNILVVAIFAIVILFGGIYSIKNIPLDAIPDLSDTQVIVFTDWKGRSPQLVEDQVTYPIVSKLLAAPKVKTVRGQSFFGLSFVYVIFEDGTDIYWARSRVLEYLNTIDGSLPKDVNPIIGPDATGVGWGYQYVLVDKQNKYDLAYMRTLNDWYLKYWIEAVPGVAEVASVGGYVKQYQIEIDPNKLRALNVNLSTLIEKVRSSNQATGARTLELAGHEYLINVDGYLRSIEDIELISLGVNSSGVPIRVKDVANVKEGPDMRRGAADYNGLGDTVGGIVVMRFGENALNVIKKVKEKIKEVKKGLPEGVEIKTVYDRSDLIHASIDTLKETLLEESLIVAVVVTIFLFDLSSALIIILTLPFVFLIAFIAMYAFGISSNIMSLGGIAIAVGDLIDGSVVMVEDTHKNIEKVQERKLLENKEERLSFVEKRDVILKSAKALGKPIFMSLMITTVSFLPIFALEAQEGRLFHPLAYTKTFVMFFAAFLAITLTPALMTLLIPNKVKSESKNPISRYIVKIYDPIIGLALKKPLITVAIALMSLLLSVPVIYRIGSEFMPPLNEGTILYMPSSLPGLGITEATRMAQIQDKLIMTVPEVESVFAKVGRATTSTDPAPLDMFETIINLKDKKEWRPGMTWDKIIEELDKKLQIPGITNAWTMPIKGRIDMLSTGLRTPLGIKLYGSDLSTLEKTGQHIEHILSPVKGTRSIFSQRTNSGFYLNINIDRERIARHGLSVKEVETVIESALGGDTITTTVEGKERFDVIVRYKREFRDSVERIKNIYINAHNGRHQIPLSQVAEIKLEKGPMSIKDEDASLVSYVYIDIADRDIGSYVDEAKKLLDEKLDLPTGYRLEWTGQYEFLQRIQKKLSLIVPITLFIVFVLTYFIYNSFAKAAIVLLSLPFAMIGGLWFMWMNGFNFSVATGVGFIGLLGLANETAIVMLVFIDEALNDLFASKQVDSEDIEGVKNNFEYKDIKEAVHIGAVQRVRPKVMTVVTTILGFLPIFFLVGKGSDVMQRIAAPMFGGLISSSVLTLLIIPSVYLLWLKWRYKLK